MKNLYTTIILALMATASIAQEYSANSTTVKINDNQIVAIDEAKNSSENELNFRYYYFPNLYAYYDLKTNNYIYKVNNKWETSPELPQYYGGYSLFKNTRIPLKNYTGDNPQKELNEHKKQFPYIKKSRMLKSLKIDGNNSISSIN